jgi:hypothetical protein
MESFMIKLGAGMVDYPSNSGECQRQKERVQQSEVASFILPSEESVTERLWINCACQLLCLEKREDCLFGYSWLALMIVIGFWRRLYETDISPTWRRDPDWLWL